MRKVLTVPITLLLLCGGACDFSNSTPAPDEHQTARSASQALESGQASDEGDLTIELDQGLSFPNTEVGMALSEFYYGAGVGESYFSSLQALRQTTGIADGIFNLYQDPEASLTMRNFLVDALAQLVDPGAINNLYTIATEPLSVEALATKDEHLHILLNLYQEEVSIRASALNGLSALVRAGEADALTSLYDAVNAFSPNEDLLYFATIALLDAGEKPDDIRAALPGDVEHFADMTLITPNNTQLEAGQAAGEDEEVPE